MSVNENKKGFAGLTTLTSVVDPIISQPVNKNTSESQGASVSEDYVALPPLSNVLTKYKYSPEIDFLKKYWLWILIGIGAIYLLIIENNEPSSSNSTSSFSSKPPPKLMESIPLPRVGKPLVLSAAEIYYCLAEELRIEANRKSMNSTVDASLERFNKTVDDFNSRCSQYSYEKYSMTAAKNALEPNKDSIKAQGRARM